MLHLSSSSPAKWQVHRVAAAAPRSAWSCMLAERHRGASLGATAIGVVAVDVNLCEADFEAVTDNSRIWAMRSTHGVFPAHHQRRTAKASDEGRVFGSGDGVTIELDRRDSAGKLSAMRNGEWLGELFDDIPKDVEIRPFVFVFDRGTKVTIRMETDEPGPT